MDAAISSYTRHEAATDRADLPAFDDGTPSAAIAQRVAFNYLTAIRI